MSDRRGPGPRSVERRGPLGRDRREQLLPLELRGDGVFRSTDGGRTWHSRGLEDAERIGRILVDPRDSNRVYVAVLGKLYTEGGKRGVYRTTDGGASWQPVLEGGPRTGVVDLLFDPSDPDVLYAASWERFRRPWEFVEGGEGSGIWKTTDRGASWTRLSGGFPSGDHVGRIGLAISPAKPSTVYAMLDNQRILPEEEWDLGATPVTPKRLRTMTREEFLAQEKDDVEAFLNRFNLDPELDAEALMEKVENEEITLDDLVKACMDANTSLFESDIRGIEVWRSDDAGATWKRTHEESLRDLAFTYGYYFGQVRVSPKDPDKIYILGVPLLTSEDGGKTFQGRNAPNVHVDHQAMWIDPEFPDRILIGNDGGLYLTHNDGKSWLKLNTVSTGQFYTVAVDMADPYHIYGGLQDNGVLKGPSNWREGDPSWERVGGGDGMYIQIDPRDNETVYLGYQFGNYSRIDPSGKRTTVKPRTALKEPVLRFNWCTPIQLSPHSPDIFYIGANKIFRSLDRGETLVAISPDLTTATERGNVPFATITTLAESPLEFGVIWAGTDDGNVQVSEDGGKSWQEVSGDLVDDRWVTRVEPSSHEDEVCYVSFSGYRDDDPTPYLYRTEDLGASWTSIADGLPHEPINVVKEDPRREDLLYVGTDRGVYLSEDRGESWAALSGGIPNVPVHDLVVHPRERELVAGTHGRSIWVLDVLPIQDLDDEIRAKAVYLYPVDDIKASRGWKRRARPWWDRPDRVAKERYTFWTKEGGKGEFQLLDEDGRVLRREPIDATPGFGVFDWDYLVDLDLALPAERERLAAVEEEEEEEEDTEGDEDEPDVGPLERGLEFEHMPYVPPGKYRVRIELAGEGHERELEVKAPEPLPSRKKKKPKIREKASRSIRGASEAEPREEEEGGK